MVTHFALPIVISLHFETPLLSCYIEALVKPSTPLAKALEPYPVTTSHTVFPQDNSSIAYDFSTYASIQDTDLKITRHIRAGFHISL